MAIHEYSVPSPTDIPNITVKTLAWFAGIMEGEGSFLWNSGPTLSLAMTDQDIVQRVADLIQYEITDYVPKRLNAKRVYVTRAAGLHTAGWMMTLYPLMGTRRRLDIAQILTRWKKAPGVPRGRKGERLPAFCHSDRLRFAKGLCQQCYNKQLMQTWRLETKAICHPDRIVKGYGLCNRCYLREYHAKLTGKPSKLDGLQQKTRIAICHPARPHFSSGLCASCYQRQRRNTLKNMTHEQLQLVDIA